MKLKGGHINKNISIIGLGHAFEYQYKALKNYFNNVKLCDIDISKIKKYKNKLEIYGNYDFDNSVIILDEKKHYIKYIQEVLWRH